ncbi:PREDICTED: putative odorant receptor 92a [Nicrophorus vespilloides]|uniref:Odorant receptor n=1 Tax=Nicrophorus vespilloides TaxID=110193 RepID=A0ABM1MUF4_NICVS|nr:PREDICTED: putative odorant receptor 92a [Nicrophorus vespilloides]
METFSKDDNIFYENFVYLRFCKLWNKPTIVVVLVRFFYQSFVMFGSSMHFITSKVSKGYLSDFVEDCAMIVAGIGMNLAIFGFGMKRKEIWALLTELNAFKVLGKPIGFERKRKIIDMCIIFYKYAVVLSLFYYTSLGPINKSKCLKNKEESHLERICGLVVQAWYNVDAQSTPQNQILFALQNGCALFIVSAYGAIYALIFSIVEHIILRIKHLKHSLKQIDEMDSLQEKQKRFKNCVIYHNSIINNISRLTDQMNRCFSIFMFVAVLVDTMIIGILVLQFLIESSLRVLLHLMGWVITLMIVSVSGQRLLDESSSLPLCVYNLNWFQYPSKFRKDLILMIIRSQRPLALKTGDFGVMSFETFLAILKTSYSYIALLKQTL